MGIRTDERWVVEKLEDLQDAFNGVLDCVRSKENGLLAVNLRDAMNACRALLRVVEERDVFDDR